MRTSEIKFRFEYAVPTLVDAALKNHARWSWQGTLPHPLPAKESSFAKYVVASNANSWDAVYDEAGLVSIVDLRPPVFVPYPIDTASAERVQCVWNRLVLDGMTDERKVWGAEYFGFGRLSDERRPLPRDESARVLRMSVSRYEVLLMGVVALVAKAIGGITP